MIGRVSLRDGRSVLVRKIGAAHIARMNELAPGHSQSLLLAPGLSLAAFDRQRRIVAVAQYARLDDRPKFAIVVAETWRSVGLGTTLLELLRHYAFHSQLRQPCPA